MNNSDIAYRKMLEDKIKKLQGQISDLEKKNTGLRLTNDYTTEAIERKKLEVEKLQEELKDYTEKAELGAVGETFVEEFDSIVDMDNEKKQAAQDKISELQDLKSRLTTARAQRKIDRKIRRQQKIIENLQKKDNFISGVQRVFMYPKYRKEMKKKQLLSNQEAKIAVAEANYHDAVEMQAMLDPDNSFVDRIKDSIYEWKKSRYLRKRERAAEILDKMQKCDSPIQMRGAVPVVITKRLKDKFTGKLQQEQMMYEAAQEYEQTQDMALAAAK